MLAIITTNLLRRSTRTVFTASGIAVGVATIVALLAFTQGLKETAAGFVHLGGSELGVFQSNVSEPTASVLPESIVARMAANPEVARATPLLLIVEGLKANSAAIVFGVEPAGFFAHNLVLTVAGSRKRERTKRSSATGWPQSCICSPAASWRSRDTPTASPASTTRASCSRTPAPFSRSPRPSSWPAVPARSPTSSCSSRRACARAGPPRASNAPSLARR